VENSDEAKDISQEVFIKALDSLSKFRGESSLKTWLYRIAVNMATNSIRKQKLRTFFSISKDSLYEDMPETNPNPEEEFTNTELEKEFLSALRKLPKRQRETFAFRYFEEMPYSEISEILGVSVGALKANYFHAVKKLSLELGKYLEIKRMDNEDE
jgi:RNA polymerase sigma-70 factor (ECF subfamily)